MLRVRRTVLMALVMAILLISTDVVALSAPAAQRQVVFVVDCLTYVVDGAPARADAAPFIRDGRTFVPVRFLAYALGVSEEGIIWDAATQTVTLTMGAVSVRLRTGSPFIVVSDVPREMDVTPLIVPPGRVVLPARFVAEAFGFEVGWDPSHRAVLIGPPGRLPGVPPMLAVTVATVVEVVAADTIRVALVGGFVETLRLIGATAPRLSPHPEPFAAEAVAYVKDLLPIGAVVYVEFGWGGRDGVGHLPAYVWLGRPFDGGEPEVRGQMLNALLLRDGHAWLAVGGDVPYAPVLASLEREARAAARGVWQSAAVTPVATTSTNIGPPVPLSVPEVIALVQPAMVSVRTNRTRGSGFFVASDGRVLTNAHVVRGGRYISVITFDGTSFPASILKIDNHTDLAILALNAPAHLRFPIISHLRYLQDVRVGDDVLAFGDPLGLDRTVTRGMVGAMREVSPSLGAWIPDLVSIQHDAAIAPGSSGGPVVNLYGEWIGVNTLGVPGEEFAFAMPADHYYWLNQEGNYDLQDDWFSYYTEEYEWVDRWQTIVPILSQAMRAPWGPAKVSLLREALAALSWLRDDTASYHPRYPEIQELARLYVRKLEANMAYNTFILTVALDPPTWSQTIADNLWATHIAARDSYYAARRRIADALD